VELFFYTLVYVYDTKNKVTIGSTHKQHGKGSTEGAMTTHACHSALFTSLETMLDGEKIEIFKDTHFGDSANSTVKLPMYVNQFDCYLEGQNSSGKSPGLRLLLLDIINQVSQGEMPLLEAMNKYLEYFEAQCKKYKEKVESETSNTSDISKQDKILICESQRNGTLYWYGSPNSPISGDSPSGEDSDNSLRKSMKLWLYKFGPEDIVKSDITEIQRQLRTVVN
jgi:hypothetical protein